MPKGKKGYKRAAGTKKENQNTGSMRRRGRSSMQMADDMTSGGVERRAGKWQRVD